MASTGNDLPSTSDFCIVGGGIIGIAIARELAKRHPDASIVLIEKEDDVSQHASGRNSGVLHAGFYYSPESFKAKLTRAGNVFLHEYIEEKGLRINKCGKLVVARNEEEVRPSFGGASRNTLRATAVLCAREVRATRNCRECAPRVSYRCFPPA
jgi:glycine/D-amino acid oxidase-like deaminating enzyme